MILKDIFNFILNFLYPPRCIFCSKVLEINTKENFCDECKENLPYLKDKICCTRCGEPLVSFGKKKLCYNCLNTTHFYISRNVSVFEYSDYPKDSVLRYKDHPKKFYAKIYAKLLYERLLEAYKNINFDCIVSVPPDKKRTLKRGCDHIALICTEFSLLSDIPFYEDCLVRIKKTKKQSTLSYTERLTNLKDSIRCKSPELIKDKVCLIIDDVSTTGSTLKECAKELKFSGCKKVFSLTICKTTKKLPKNVTKA